MSKKTEINFDEWKTELDKVAYAAAEEIPKGWKTLQQLSEDYGKSVPRHI